MCLPDFVGYKKIKKLDALIGYRDWRLKIDNPIELISLNQDYEWKYEGEKNHLVKDKDSGIYAYNNYYKNYYYKNYYYNNNCYNYYYYNNYNNNCYNNYYYYYYLNGIIKQYGKVAIHKIGYRSQYAKIETLFTIRKSDAQGPKEFLDWIDKFNNLVEELTKKYSCKTMHYQDFVGHEI